jgi:hypothetical protein
MHTTARLASVGGLALAATVLAATAASASPGPPPAHHRGAAVFVQTDNPAGNTIVAYDQSAGGALQQVGIYPTGGNGGVLAGSVVDHLASQGSPTATATTACCTRSTQAATPSPCSACTATG